jgi:hypothetical protein
MLQAERLVVNCRDQNAPLMPGAMGLVADMRTAINRCYYSTFLYSRELFYDLGYNVTVTGRCHGVVHRALIACKDNDLDGVVSDYGTLGEARRKADYVLTDASVERVKDAEIILIICK